MPQTRMADETRARIARLWPSIVNGIAAGEAIGDVLAMAGVSVYVARQFMAENPERREEWENAKRDSASAFFDEAIRIANNPGDPHLARVRADLYLRMAAKRDPREYSDKTTLDVNVKMDLTRIISEANARLELRERGRLIEHEARALPRAASDAIAVRVLQEGVGGGTDSQITDGG